MTKTNKINTRLAMVTEAADAGGAAVSQNLIDMIKPMFKGVSDSFTFNASDAFTNFLGYLNNQFSISNLDSLRATIAKWCEDMAGNGGVFGKIVAGLGSAVGKALEFAAKMCNSLLQSFPSLNNAAFGGKFTCGTVIAMAVAAGCVLYIFAKICKIFKRKFSESTPDKTIRLYAALSLREAILEADIMYSKLNRLAESNMLTEANIMQSVNGILSKAIDICNDLFDWIDDVVSAAANGAYTFASKHHKFVTAVLICIGLVMTYNGCPEIRQAINSAGEIASNVGTGVAQSAGRIWQHSIQ